MEVYKTRAKRGKLKYYDEHISFLLDRVDSYDWRKIRDERIECLELSLPENLEFITSKCKFKELDSYDWLKSDFMIPVFHNRFIEALRSLGDSAFKIYPIVIKDSKNRLNLNNNFSAVYINCYLDCIDRENSQSKTTNQGSIAYDFMDTQFRDDIEYPILFRIKDISTFFMHFTTVVGRKKLADCEIIGLEFEGK